MLRLDPIADREEYAALAQALENVGAIQGSNIRETIDRMWAHPDPLHSLGVRARNLGVDRWQVWSGADEGSLEELVQPGGPRCVVADLGSLATQEEPAVAAESMLAALWRRRAVREPVLIVVDEAHNVCPGVPEDPLTAMATEHADRGRRPQVRARPARLHPASAEGARERGLAVRNLVLMRMNSRSDVAVLSEIFSFVPAPLLGLASEFRRGEAIVAGKLVPSPTLARIGPRWSVEGGSDVPADWAAPR